MRASYASQADFAKNAYQATIASMALESQKMNQGGDMIIIEPTNHYVIMVGANQDPSTSIVFDLINRRAINLTVIPPAENPEVQDTRLNRLEQRLKVLESLLAEK
jgi:hypothetical protein